MDSGEPSSNYVLLNEGPAPTQEAALLEGMMSGHRPSTVLSGSVDQRSDCPVAEAVEFHVKLSQWETHLRCGLSLKFFDHLFGQTIA